MEIQGTVTTECCLALQMQNDVSPLFNTLIDSEEELNILICSSDFLQLPIPKEQHPFQGLKTLNHKFLPDVSMKI